MATAQHPLSDYDPNLVPHGKNRRFILVVSEWNHKITESLFIGAKETLENHGVLNTDIQRINVPGSFELVYGSKIAQKEHPDAVIAIGSVIQGETRHFDYVCQAVSQGIMQLNTQAEVPVIFCVLTDDTLSQAQDRSGGQYGNKGVEAAVAALKMAALKDQSFQ